MSVWKKGNVERVATNEEQERKLEGKGFKPIDSKKEKAADPKDISTMKVAELQALAKEKGIEGASSLNKEELLAVLKDVV